RVRLHPVGASAGGRDALGYSQQRLHMMSDLVRDDVCLGEIARSAEARMQLLVETEVDVRLTVGGAIEWTDLRLRIAATRLHCAGEQHQLRLAVLTPGCGEDLTPGLLGISQHNGDELAQLRLGWRLFVGSLFDHAWLLRQILQHDAGILTKIDREQHEQQAPEADAARLAEPHASAILDVRAAAPAAPSHAGPLSGPRCEVTLRPNGATVHSKRKAQFESKQSVENERRAAGFPRDASTGPTSGCRRARRRRKSAQSFSSAGRTPPTAAAPRP